MPGLYRLRLHHCLLAATMMAGLPDVLARLPKLRVRFVLFMCLPKGLLYMCCMGLPGPAIW
jgi:hypothetical protein